MADALDHRHVVGDEQEGELHLCLQVEQQIDHLRLDRDIERRDAFVGDDHLRLERQRARDADALALAAGELVRIAVAMSAGQPDAAQQLGDPDRAPASGSPACA
jgi:hypothetical protein